MLMHVNEAPMGYTPQNKLCTPSFKIIESCSLSRYADINSLLCCKTQAAHHKHAVYPAVIIGYKQ